MSDVAGVPTLVRDEVNGLLVPSTGRSGRHRRRHRPPDPDGDLRRRLIATANRAARAHTADSHARKIALGLVKLAGIHLRRDGR